MINPSVLNPRPGLILSFLGGCVAMLLLSALLFLAPVLGFPFLDIPHLVGGVFFDSPTTAFWVGFWINFVVGAFIFAPALSFFWPMLPGPGVGFRGAILRGILWGIALWVLSGVLLPIFAALNRLGADVVRSPGPFAIATGVRGVVALLGGHLVYGLALALIATMGEGIVPLETLGWPGYLKGEVPPGDLLPREERLPEYQPVGVR